MSAEALLENPALFSGKIVPPFQLAREYLQLASPTGLNYVPIYDFNKCIKAHIARFLHAPIKRSNRLNSPNGTVDESQDVASIISSCRSVDELVDGVSRIENLYLGGSMLSCSYNCSSGAELCRDAVGIEKAVDRSVSPAEASAINIDAVDDDISLDTWYRRHRDGCIEVDRNKRKLQQQLWIDAGLRMNR
jgi:hypothetical protein